MTRTPTEPLPSSSTSYFCPTLQSSVFKTAVHSSIVFPFLLHRHSTALVFLNPLDFDVRSKSLQLCPTLCDPIDCSLPDSSVHGILQARILEWVAKPSSRGSTQLRDGNCISCVSCIGRQVLYHWHHLGSPTEVIKNLEMGNYPRLSGYF